LPENRSIKISSKGRYALITSLVVVFTVVACVAVIYYWEYIGHLQNYGYIGPFIFGFIAGSSIPVPLPYLVVTFTMGGVLNPALVGIASGLGAGIGGTLVYLFGRGGRSILPKLGIPTVNSNSDTKTSRWVAKFVEWAHRRGSVVVFMMSAMLNPAFAPMAITMGALRFRLVPFLLWCSAGNIVKSLVIAYCGYYGLGTLLRWLGAF